MPKIVYFNNKQVIEPGVYTQSIGGVEQAPVEAENGVVLILDTGSNATWGGGAGINGAQSQGIDSIYEFDSYDAYKRFVKGGILGDAGYWVFNPAGFNPGASSVLYVRAAQTTQATLSISFENGDLEIKTIDEGVVANGIVADTVLNKGYGVTLKAGVDDDSKYIMQFWLGTYSGADSNSEHWDGVAPADTEPLLLVESDEVSNIEELVEWMNGNSIFKSYFTGQTSSNLTGSGDFTATDITNNSAYQPFAGATETYGAADLDDAIEAITESGYTFLLADNYGVTDGKGTENNKLWAHITTEAVYEKFLVIGGGADSTEFDQSGASSIDIANSFDSERVFVVHSEVRMRRNTGGFRTYSTLHHAAAFAGRLAGLEPQTPATWKALGFDEPVHKLNKRERGKALLNGLNHLRQVNGEWVINQEVTSLTQNSEFIYPDGSSPEGSVMRISAALNKFVKTNTELQVIGNNVNLAGPEDVVSIIEGLLKSRTATDTTDNLILSFREVRASQNGGDATAQYKFTPNGPVNRLFITSVILNVNL